MDTKGRNEELAELKGQMERLKEELHKSEIIDKEQIAEISKTYKPKHRVLKAIVGALFGLLLCANSLSRIFFNHDQEPWWLLILSILVVLIMMFMYAYMYAGSSYEIKDDRLVLRDILKRETVVIPVDKIRFIEFMANKSQGARIMYNKFDDFYLRDVKIKEIIEDILRVNPEIEIRREMA